VSVENDNKKILTMSFLAAAVLVFFVTGMLLDTFSATWGWFARVFNNDITRAMTQTVLAGITFFALQFNKRVMAFSDEVVVELKKIVWPSRKDTVAMTIVVVVMVVISAVIFSTFDAVAGWAVSSLPGWMNTILR
jgi:preprotein translocase subunit SecE